MADTYTLKTAQQNLSALVREAADHPVTITKQGRAVAVLVSIERMEGIAETMELLADPKAMAAIRKHREGRAVYPKEENRNHGLHGLNGLRMSYES